MERHLVGWGDFRAIRTTPHGSHFVNSQPCVAHAHRVRGVSSRSDRSRHLRALKPRPPGTSRIATAQARREPRESRDGLKLGEDIGPPSPSSMPITNVAPIIPISPRLLEDGSPSFQFLAFPRCASRRHVLFHLSPVPSLARPSSAQRGGDPAIWQFGLVWAEPAFVFQAPQASNCPVAQSPDPQIVQLPNSQIAQSPSRPIVPPVFL
jgi:hypothetical protein